MSDFYDNLLKATNNLDAINTEKFATITRINGNYCDAKETDTGLEHTNVPILNGAKLTIGDKAIIGFLNNSIYETVCYGVLDRTTDIDSSNIIEDSALTNLGLGAGANQHQINLKVNEKINQGGGGGGTVMVGSFEIDQNGHLIATIPDGASNPYHIDFNTGHLIYDTTAGSDT